MNTNQNGDELLKLMLDWHASANRYGIASPTARKHFDAIAGLRATLEVEPAGWISTHPRCNEGCPVIGFDKEDETVSPFGDGWINEPVYRLASPLLQAAEPAGLPAPLVDQAERSERETGAADGGSGK